MDDFCAVHSAIQLLQEKWTLHIIRGLLPGPMGFNELGRAVGGCNSATLAQRLDRLERTGVITRTVQSTMPPRTSYELTCDGRKLQAVIDAIDSWARGMEVHLRPPALPAAPVPAGRLVAPAPAPQPASAGAG